LLLAAVSASNACARDELLKDLFPGVRFSRYAGDDGSDLFATAQARFESGGRQYVALTYYQPYPEAPRLRFASFALLELADREYKLVLDHRAADDGSGLEFPSPFLYTVGAQDLVVFPECYRGCHYSFFRLDAKPTPVTLQVFDGLAAEESFSGRGDLYRFEKSGLSATFNVARTGDAACCPGGGTLQVFYVLRGNQFRISRVERNELAPAFVGRVEGDPLENPLASQRGHESGAPAWK
jgi:hypothetical protein